VGTLGARRATILTVTSPSPRLSSRRGILVSCLLLALALTALVSACGDDPGPDDSTLSAAGRRGKQVANDNGCAACHSTSGSKSTGPTWKGLAGSTVELADGSTVTADDDYLRRSTTDPTEQIVDGYPSGVMPAYDLSDADMDDLIAYLHDLAKPTN
jgi:mono/diheme cytochrome c family protein